MVKNLYAELKSGEEGGGLFAFGSKDKIDPYCKILITSKKKASSDRAKYQSPVHKNAGKHPKWPKATHQFKIKKKDKDFQVQIWDDDSGSGDDLLGLNITRLDRAAWRREKPLQIPVYAEKDKKKKKIIGTMFVTVQYFPDENPEEKLKK